MLEVRTGAVWTPKQFERQLMHASRVHPEIVPVYGMTDDWYRLGALHRLLHEPVDIYTMADCLSSHDEYGVQLEKILLLKDSCLGLYMHLWHRLRPLRPLDVMDDESVAIAAAERWDGYDNLFTTVRISQPARV